MRNYNYKENSFVCFARDFEDPVMLERTVVSVAELSSTSVLELHEMSKDSFFIKVTMTSSFTSSFSPSLSYSSSLAWRGCVLYLSSRN